MPASCNCGGNRQAPLRGAGTAPRGKAAGGAPRRKAAGVAHAAGARDEMLQLAAGARDEMLQLNDPFDFLIYGSSDSSPPSGSCKLAMSTNNKGIAKIVE